MRYVQFLHAGVRKLGCLEPAPSSTDVVVDLSASDGFPYKSMLEFLQDGDAAESVVQSILEDAGKKKTLSTGQVSFLSPITSPDKVICIGMNYHDHCEEQGVPIPQEPVIFNKFPSTIVGPYDNVLLCEETTALDWEVELAVVIGKTGRRIQASDAMDHVFGYTVAFDVSARDWQMHRNGGQWLVSKSMDTFCPLGPCLVTKQQIKDPHNLGIRCRVNSVTKQESNTKELVFKTQELISHITRFVTVHPGDVILTGTPPGVGCFRNPPEYLKKGDVVECEIDNIGTIMNTIV